MLVPFHPNCHYTGLWYNGVGIMNCPKLISWFFRVDTMEQSICCLESKVLYLWSLFDQISIWFDAIFHLKSILFFLKEAVWTLIWTLSVSVLVFSDLGSEIGSIWCWKHFKVHGLLMNLLVKNMDHIQTWCYVLV